MKIVRFKDGFCLRTTDEQAYELVKAIKSSQEYSAIFELEHSKEGFRHLVRMDDIQCIFNPDKAVMSFKD